MRAWPRPPVPPRVPRSRRGVKPAAANRDSKATRSRAQPRVLVAALLLTAFLVAACAGDPTGKTRTPRPSPTAGATPGVSAAPATPSADARELRIRDSARWYLNHLSLDEKLGQMFLIETVWQHYNDDVDGMVRRMHAGALIVYGQNMQSPSQLRSYLADIQSHATIPLLTSMDEEGGVVDRLGYFHFAPPLPAAQDLAASGSPQQARQAGVTAAQEMLDLGLNTDLAPVADVRSVPDAVEWTRLFGDDPATVDRYAGAFLDGLQANGVAGCVKHWPGIGSITADPHETLPVLDRSRAQLAAADFAAFKGLLADNPAMIMVTHVVVPAYDGTLPATLSPTLVDGVLRGQLGYDGVVMTDSLYMKGISLRYTLPEAAVMAVQAGDDLLEGAFDSSSMASMLAALKAALADGRISPDRIDQSALRILTLKVRYGLLPLLASPHLPATDDVTS